tara:strand:+ start:10702 stop:11736 length:1035 start_codon:yes stop_codon:yes gene_type:complete
MTEAKLRELLAELGIPVVDKTGSPSRSEWLVCRCPFASTDHISGTDSRPSFSFKINPEGYSGFNCFTCKRHGNLTIFLSSLGIIRGENYSDLIVRAWTDEVPNTFGEFEFEERESDYLTSIDEDTEKVLYRIYPRVHEFSEACNYLECRGITLDAAEQLGLRYDKEDKRIMFPVRGIDSSLYGFTGRAIYDDLKPKVKDYAGLKKSCLLLGEHLIPWSEGNPDRKPILVVEGLFALAHMVSLGVREFCNPVATMGSSMSEAQRDSIVDLDNPVYMLYDNDDAGEVGMFGRAFRGGGALDMLLPHVPVYMCLYPEGIDDPDDLNLEQVKEMVLGEDNEIYTSKFV